MKKLSIDFISKAVSGKIIQGKKTMTVKGVSIDSRTINKNEIFFAIYGDNFDGHDFINDAIKKGANSVIVEKEINIKDNEINIIKVSDTTEALQNLAKSYRSTLETNIVGITGSAGKTTTKDITSSLLSEKYKTKKTQGNYNNYYGLPLTILELDGDEDIAVLEMGMSQLGEIALLTDIAEPDIGIITNVGETHLESLGSIENVARGKSELISGLSENTIAVLNYDNKYVRDMADLFKGKELIYYGLSSEADIYADNINIVDSDITEFMVHYQGESVKLQIDRPGQHNIYNSLAAIIVARKMNIDWLSIKKALLSVEYSALRWDVKKNQVGAKIINDTYNANPLSMKAAIDAAKNIAKGRIILVLGAMLELGDIEKEAHQELGAAISGKDIDLLITVGKTASHIAGGAEKAGMQPKKIEVLPDNDEVVKFLKGYQREKDLILVKGSRGNKMEEIIKELV